MDWKRCFGNIMPGHENFKQRFEDERRKRIVPKIRMFSLYFFLVNLSVALIPRSDSIPFEIWLYYRCWSLGSAAALVICSLIWTYSPRAWACYDVLNFVWGAHLMMQNQLTLRHTHKLFGTEPTIPVYDEGFALFLNIAAIACFWFYGEPHFLPFTLMVHISICPWLCLGIFWGTDCSFLDWTKLTVCYYFAAVMLLLQCRREINHRVQLLSTCVALEEQLNTNKALAKSESDAAMKGAQQAGLLSFTRAVFDIVGYLSWHTVEEFDEPRLCFSDEQNSALDELLQQPTAGKQLDILLGAMPPQRGPDRDEWQQERQRLWTYATVEARSYGSAVSGDQELPPARKIALACRDVGSNRIEIELFVRAYCDGKALFGILAGPIDRSCRTPSVSTQPLLPGRMPSAPSELTCGSSLSSSSVLPLEDLNHLNGDDGAMAWVDAAGHGLPLLKSTASFLALLGGPLPYGTRLEKRLIDGWVLCDVLANRLKEMVAQVSIERDKLVGSLEVSVRGPRCGKSFVQVRGTCTFDFSPTFEVGDNWGEDAVPVLLTFSGMSAPFIERRVRVQKRGTRQKALLQQTQPQVQQQHQQEEHEDDRVLPHQHPRHQQHKDCTWRPIESL